MVTIRKCPREDKLELSYFSNKLKYDTFIAAAGISSKSHPINLYDAIGASSMSGTPIRPKPTNELKAASMSTLSASPIQPSPSLSLPPGIVLFQIFMNKIKF